jgi:hypothetical protein
LSPPLVTVFTCTVYPDIARIWHACVTRAIPAEESRIEIFQDAEGPGLPAEFFPRTAILRRGPSRRDFQEAYNDALRRAETPYLAFIDSDVYWVSKDLWPAVKRALADPRVAAVSCVRRSRADSHGTFSVVMKVEIYREILRAVPEGFLPAAKSMDIARPYAEWQWYDTGDLACEAVVRAGYEVKYLAAEETGDLVLFRNITVFRRPAEWVGIVALEHVTGRYFWRGYGGNLALKYVHDALFANGPRYAIAWLPGVLFGQLTGEGGRWRIAYAWELWRKASRVRAFAT